jgi:peptide/nickel transport system substrate-binding protein
MRPIVALLAAALLLPATQAGAQAGAQGRGDPNTLRVKLFGDLRSIDPFISPEYMARNHGYMVYDTLFALDSKLAPQPQMVARWTTSPDSLTWDFTLREGLRFHDGAAVTSADVIASLKRWAVRDGLGQQLMGLATAIEPTAPDAFRITLRAPFGLMLQALAKPSGQPAFIMPARVAETPAATPVTDPTGSGPFTLRREDWRAGDRVT